MENITLPISPITTAIRRMARFTSNSTWTAPAGVTSVYITGVGGGGGGGGTNNSLLNRGGGGGSGGWSIKTPITVVPETKYTITIGVGGTGALNLATSATDGTSSSVGSVWIANGGGAGGTTNANSAFILGAPGMPSTGTNRGFQFSYGGATITESVGYPEIISYSNVDDASPNFIFISSGANSLFGSGGITLYGDTSGENASGYGAGGSGGNFISSGFNIGGNGSSGLIIIEW